MNPTQTQRILLGLLLLFFFGSQLHAATVSGRVCDKETNKGISFVNIWVKETQHGTTSDIHGHFSIDINNNSTLEFSAIGYESHTQIINNKPHQPLSIALSEKAINLNEVTVEASYERDKSMFEKILEQKETNNDKLKAITQYTNDDRTTVLLASDSTARLHRLLKNKEESFIYDQQNGQQYIPIYISEKKTEIDTKEHYSNSDLLIKDGIFPQLNREIENMVLNKVAIDFNFYKNQINVLDRGFRSPLSNNALLFYRIYISDSIVHNDTKYYKFNFYPKNKQATVFTGYFWVEDQSFALTSIHAILPQEAKVNFIQNLELKINYKKLSDGTWFYDDLQTIVNFSLGNTEDDCTNLDSVKTGNMIMNRSVKYTPKQDTVDLSKGAVALTPIPNSLHYDLIGNQVASGIKNIQENKVLATTDKVGNAIFSGYFLTNKIDFGPVYELYSSNIIEGHRISVPIRTGKDISEKFSVGAYLGYGFKSEKVKYGLEVNTLLPREKRTIFSLYYADDYFLPNRSDYKDIEEDNPYNKGDGNVLTSLTTTELNPYVFHQQKVKARLTADISHSTELMLTPYYTRSYQSAFVPFSSSNTSYGSYDNAGAMLNMRLSFGQPYDELYFARIYYGELIPVINLNVDVGRIQMLDEVNTSLAPYVRTYASIKQRINIGPAYIRYLLRAGYMMGDLPYTMLEKPSGSNSLGYSKYGYNLLDFAAYAHNLYTNLHVSITGGGIIFNRLPLIKRLNIREIISLKTYYGEMTSGVNMPFDMPGYYQTKMPGVYSEIGFGVTNLFKVLRVEYIHRLSNQDEFKGLSSSGGIRLELDIRF